MLCDGEQQDQNVASLTIGPLPSAVSGAVIDTSPFHGIVPHHSPISAPVVVLNTTEGCEEQDRDSESDGHILRLRGGGPQE